MAIEDVRNFTWHVFCDYYIEAVKDKLYDVSPQNQAKKVAAQQTLYEVLYRVLQLLAPVTPHVTEEIYQHMFKENKCFESLQISRWPKFNAALVDEEAEKKGDLIIAVISQGRQAKAEHKLPLNLPLRNVVIRTGNSENVKAILGGKADIAGTLKVEDLKNITVEYDGKANSEQINPADVVVTIAWDSEYDRQ